MNMLLIFSETMFFLIVIIIALAIYPFSDRPFDKTETKYVLYSFILLSLTV